MGEDPKTEQTKSPLVSDNQAAGVTPPSPANPVGTETVGQPMKKYSTSIVFVIVTAVIIAAGLLTLGFLAYNSKDKPVKTETTTTQNNQNAEPSGAVTESELNQQSTEIDQTTKDLDNSKDFNQDNLSDQNVGL